MVSAFRRNSFLSHTAIFVLALLPGLALMLALNAARYGAPLASGYGSTDVLFSPAHVWPNLLRYPRWALETHTPFVLLALAAPWTLRRDPARAWLATIALACAALLLATYLAYTVFDDWWYIRFLLPALPVVMASSVVVLRAIVARLSGTRERAVLAAACALLCLWYVHVARVRHVMDLQGLESRFRLAGEYAGRTLPPNAVVLAVQESGSVRFHGGRDTIAWDQIPRDALDRTIGRLRAAGREPFLVLEDAEEQPFRVRFAGQRVGALDWPPVAELSGAVRVRVFAVDIGK